MHGWRKQSTRVAGTYIYVLQCQKLMYSATTKSNKQNNAMCFINSTDTKDKITSFYDLIFL